MSNDRDDIIKIIKYVIICVLAPLVLIVIIQWDPIIYRDEHGEATGLSLLAYILMVVIANALFFGKERLSLRESQIARLYVRALALENTTECRNVFENMLAEMIERDHAFFQRLAKSDVELMIWLIDCSPMSFEESKSRFLRGKIDPIIMNRLQKLSINNKQKLRSILRENPSFVTLYNAGYGNILNEYSRI